MVRIPQPGSATNIHVEDCNMTMNMHHHQVRWLN